MARDIVGFNDAVNYLNDKGITFAVNLNNDFVGLKIDKQDRFYRANGRVISKQYAMLIFELINEKY